MAGVLLVDESFLGSSVDGLVGHGQDFNGFVFLSLLHEIRDFLHHRLELRFVRLQTRVAHRVLACALDGGLDDRHKKRMRKTLGKARTA